MKNLVLLLILTLSACSGVDGVNGDDGADGSEGTDGLSPRIIVTAEAPGTQCPTGGQRIETGLDLNSDGNLAPLEIEDTVFICNGPEGAPGMDGAMGLEGATGADGVASLVNTSPVTPGAQCAGGGVRIDTGLDENTNGVLDVSEVSATDYVCNGFDGTNGSDGSDGANGLSSLIATDIEPAGPNCSAGGARVRTGLDSNRNNLLDTTEVQTTRYVCNGTGGAALSPVVVSVFGGYANPTYFTADQVSTLISAPITVPGPGKIIATGSVDLFCETAAAASLTDCSTFPVQGVLALTSSAALSTFADLTAQEGHVFFHAAKDSTNNLFTTRVFTVGAAGTQTYYLRMLNDNDGEIGGWRQRLTLLWVPN